MARRILHHATGASTQLVRHLLAGRALRRRMYATTPIPFLRRLRLIPDEAYFDALSSALPAWWSPDPESYPGFEFQIDPVEAVDQTAVPTAVLAERYGAPTSTVGEPLERAEPVMPTAPNRAVDLPVVDKSAPNVTSQSAPVAAAREAAHSGELGRR